MFINDEYWVKFDVRVVDVSPSKPHGLKYSLTLHGPDNKRIVGFDNSHPHGDMRWTEPHDHSHVFKNVEPYEYADAAALLMDFWSAVDKMLIDLGVL